MKGKVKFFDSTKNYGFISAENDKDYFVHKNDLVGMETLHDGEDVTFEVGEGNNGKEKAINVKKADSDSEELKEAA